jgi:site-specific recombinase XerD
VSINTYLRCLNAFFGWAHEEGLMEKLRMPRQKEEGKVVECLKPEHVKRILDFNPKTFIEWRTHALLCSLLDTGMRIDEALGLKREDLDFDNLLIKVKGKGNKQRLVPMLSLTRLGPPLILGFGPP